MTNPEIPPANDPAQATPVHAFIHDIAQQRSVSMGCMCGQCDSNIERALALIMAGLPLERDLAAARLEVEVLKRALKHELTENNKLVYKAPIGAFEAFVVAQDRRLRSALTGGKGAGR